LRFFVVAMASETVRGWWKPKDGMNLQEALAMLHGKEYERKKKPWIHYVRDAEKWFWTQRSLCTSSSTVSDPMLSDTHLLSSFLFSFLLTPPLSPSLPLPFTRFRRR
jgi:hypothetical protein